MSDETPTPQDDDELGWDRDVHGSMADYADEDNEADLRFLPEDETEGDL